MTVEKTDPTPGQARFPSKHVYASDLLAQPSLLSWIRSRLIRKIGAILERELQRIRISERHENATLAPTAILYPSCRIENPTHDRARITVGAHSHVRGSLLVYPNGGDIIIGEFCYLGESSNIWSMASIKIGDRVLIAHNVNIHDNIAHSYSAAERHTHFVTIISSGHPAQLSGVPSAQIEIDDDAWIGFNSTILKGVRIGRGAIVGADSVVTKDVAPFEIVVGNPARKIGEASP